MREKFLMIFMVFGLNSLINAQNYNSQTRERDIRNHPDFVRYLENGKSAPTKAVQIQKSEYSGLDKTISSFFYYDQIPSDFPKANENIKQEDYIIEINRWLSSNQKRIKPEMINKFINLNGEVYEKNN